MVGGAVGKIKFSQPISFPQFIKTLMKEGNGVSERMHLDENIHVYEYSISFCLYSISFGIL